MVNLNPKGEMLLLLLLTHKDFDTRISSASPLTAAYNKLTYDKVKHLENVFFIIIIWRDRLSNGLDERNCF